MGRQMAEVVAAKLAEEELLRMTADLVAAYVSNNPLPTTQLAEIINAVYSSLKGLEGQVAQPQLEPVKPAVPIRKSVTPEFLICLEDGKKLKMLKRHLRSTYNMTPDEYRVKWGLAPDGPSAGLRVLRADGAPSTFPRIFRPSKCRRHISGR